MKTLLANAMRAEPNHLLDKFEWFDVCRKLKPGLTYEEFVPMWNEFLDFKHDHDRKRAMQ